MHCYHQVKSLFLMLVAGGLLAGGGARAQDAAEKPIRALLIAGGCCHDYAKQRKILSEGISARANVEWTIIYVADGSTKPKLPIYGNPDYAKDFDVVVHDECAADINDSAIVEGVLKPHNDGMPAVVLHCGMHCYRTEGWNKNTAVTPWFALTGLNTTGHGAQLPIAITFTDTDHPITKGLENWTTVNEELYNNIKIIDGTHELARGKQGNDNNRLIWTNTYGPKKTRVFSTTLGHNNETVGDPRYLDLITRGLLWSVDKLDAKHLVPAKHALATPVGGDGKKILAPVNLALNKPTSASATQAGHTTADAVDGDTTDTRWCPPDNGVGYWWQVDLQKPEELTGLAITWEQDGKRYQYKVESSADGKAWTMLVDATKNDKREQVHEHKVTATARYIRLTLTGVENGSWGSFFEFEVLGKQMVEKAATASPVAASPAESALLKGVKGPPGFDLTLFAAPPNISYPACITATPTGDLFVGVDQNGSLGHGKNRGWIIRCTDTDGDGKADQFVKFATVDSPRGLVYTGDKLFVLHPPKLSVFPVNPDGSAGPEKVLLSGLGGGFDSPRGADHTTNGIQMGMDGWIYIAAGDFGFFHALQADGKEFQLHGGGIARVRPDGTELEVYTRGLRNIYDVSVDPYLNVYTRDNTNDGDGWDVRLNHDIQGANFGYPSLYKHYADEMLRPLLDTGGGSPTGSLFIDEPGFPEPFGHGLYTCEWGRGFIHRHPLEPNGASFKAKEEAFVKIERPTDLDVDGQAHLFIASWRGAVFDYAGPNAGFVIRLAPTGGKPAPFPDLAKATDAQLVQFLAAPSHVLRLQTQHEILRRGDKEAVAQALEALAASPTTPLAGRVAALFTLKQMRGARSTEALVRLAKNDEVREFALRALADRKGEVAAAPTKVFVEALTDKNPRVRAQAAIGLGRLGRPETASALVALTADTDPVISHSTEQSLIVLHGAEACLKALDAHETTQIPGCIRALQWMHEPQAVDGLIMRLGKTQEVALRQPLLKALCRLYYREADWNGDWWSTRPDTFGPYYKPVKWEQTEKIGLALKNALVNTDADTLSFLLQQFQRNKIDPNEMGVSLVKIATQNPKLRAAVVEMLANQTTLPADALALLEGIATSNQWDDALRVRAFAGLQHAAGQTEARDAAVHALVAWSKTEKPELIRAREEFLRDGQVAKNAAYFAKQTEAADPAVQEIAFAVLVQIAGDKNAPKAGKDQARKSIAAAWDTPAAVALLHAIGQTRAKSFSDQVDEHLKDPRPDVAAAATEASAKLSQKTPTPGKPSTAPVIGKLPYEEVLVQAAKGKGDAKLGAQLFESVGCNKCHTTAKSEPLKGPFLGDITTRYNRLELGESILRPNAKIAQGFVTNWFTMKNGDEYEGFIVREAGEEIELRNLAGVTVLAKKDIAKRGTRETSIMPGGLVDNLTIADLASLLAYLESLKGK